MSSKAAEHPDHTCHWTSAFVQPRCSINDLWLSATLTGALSVYVVALVGGPKQQLTIDYKDSSHLLNLLSAQPNSSNSASYGSGTVPSA